MMLLRTSVLCLLWLTAVASAFPFALDASIGGLERDSHWTSPDLDVAGHLWYQFDQMIFVGAGSGIEMIGKDRHFPALGSLWVRIPFGGRTLPVVTGDCGYDLGSQSQFIWRGGGGLDIKNGDHSSILLLGGYQSFQKLGGYFYLRAGLLLEL
jgi:hypothetical protein